MTSNHLREQSSMSNEWPNLDYEATDYAGLCAEISDGFMGETGDLIREHAKAVLALREIASRRARMSSDERWLKLAKLAEAATPGPWRCNAVGEVWADRDAAGWDAFFVAQTTRFDSDDANWDDAEFIAAARTAVPSLLAALRSESVDLEESP